MVPGLVNVFTAPACKISGLKGAHTHTPPQAAYFPVLSHIYIAILCFLMEIPSHAYAERKEKA